MSKTAGGAGQVVSMTGFASLRGAAEGWNWLWDIRAVNGRGLDLRLRLPEGIDGFEPLLRAEIARDVQRGNVTLGLKLSRAVDAAALAIAPGALGAALVALRLVEEQAASMGIGLAPTSAAEILQLRGVLGGEAADAVDEALKAALMADLALLIADFQASRATEGAALRQIITGQIDQIAALTGEARLAADARRPAMEAALDENLARVLRGAAEADPARIAQELALLVVKADVTEELDRLGAHVASARKLLAGGGAVGRKLDFLMQEFMREANTLCSKSGSADLTRIGLDLKTVIDQMREQVQNVE